MAISTYMNRLNLKKKKYNSTEAWLLLEGQLISRVGRPDMACPSNHRVSTDKAPDITGL